MVYILSFWTTVKVVEEQKQIKKTTPGVRTSRVRPTFIVHCVYILHVGVLTSFTDNVVTNNTNNVHKKGCTRQD